MTNSQSVDNCGVRTCESSILLPDFLYQIYFEYKSVQILQARHGVREDDEVLISRTTNNVQCQDDGTEFCSKDARMLWQQWLVREVQGAEPLHLGLEPPTSTLSPLPQS